MKIVIIEDEPKAAANLKKILKLIDSLFEVIEIIDSVEMGLAYFDEVGFPDIIFSDIQIADGLSFEIFEAKIPECPVVFCTAYDQYALQAFKANGIDYLVKPFSESDVRKSIEKIRKLRQSELEKESLKQLFFQLQKPKKQSILMAYRDKIIPISFQKISYFYSSQHTTIIWFEGKEVGINYTLDELEKMVDTTLFYRANRQFIINRAFIREIEHYFARKLAVYLTQPTPETIIVSKAKASEFLRWLEG